MFNAYHSDNVPVNLIQRPIEHATLIIWLIAFAQFFSYSFVNTATPTISWLLTAPALMLASFVIAIRAHNSLPVTVSFISGLVALLYAVNADLSSVLVAQEPDAIKAALVITSIYALFFWLLSRQFLSSSYFLKLQQLIRPDNDCSGMQLKFKSFIFYLSFFTVNSCVLISIFYPGIVTQINLIAAIVLLFVSGKQTSAQVRGILLPVYVTMFLVMFLTSGSNIETIMLASDSGSSIANSHSITFIFWALLLWSAHNFIAPHFNRLFPKAAITTTLWPWFGLLLLIVNTLNQAPSSFFSASYLALILGYLLLMLRNTSLPIISWSMILLFSWIMLVVMSLLNPQVLSFRNLSQIGTYGVQSLLFVLSLLAFSVVWDRFINRYFNLLGWQSISFRKPVLTVSFLVTMLWLVINLTLATGLISGWFDLIKEGLLIEKTTLLVFMSFIALSVFMNNKLLANLVHFSAIILLIVLWGFNKAVPVYTLFATIHLVWVILPTVLKGLSERTVLPYPQQIINSTGNWIYISFVAAISSLFIMADSYSEGFASFTFLASVGILFVASILLVRRYSNQLWIVLSYLLAAGLLVSLRFILMGDVAVNEFDTMGLLAMSLLLYVVNRWGLLPSPIISSDTLVKLVPLSVLFTLPWQAGSLHSSLTLLVLGIFYLLTQKGSRIALYLGFVLVNLAVYLWIPLLSDYTNLLLFYIMPVSISLLFVTYLHRNEISAELKNRIRFIALSLLYIVVSADVFINETLVIFILGLFFGLASVIYGISSRTRAFLYTGISFLIINILGQLMVLYPDDRLGRALILMMTGALITGSMIWFNIKREMLLAKIRLFRADLDSWE